MKLQIELSPYELYRLDGATKEMMGEDYKKHDPAAFFQARDKLVSHIVRSWMDPVRSEKTDITALPGNEDNLKGPGEPL